MRIFLAAMALLAAVLPASAAQVVVLSSTVDGFAPGSIVDDATAIEVPAGGVVIINDATGATRTLTGPYSGAIGQPSGGGDARATVIASLSRLVTSREEEQAKLGAIRALPGNLAREVYVVSVARSSVQCVAADHPVTLWRPETLRGDTLLEISETDGAETAQPWPAAVERLDWPEGLAIHDGARYRVQLGNSPRPVEIELKLVPAGLDTPAETAAWMADAGCRRQALLLVETLGG